MTTPPASRTDRTRIPSPSPSALLAAIVATCVIALTGLAYTYQVNANQLEDRATARATAESLCSLIGLFLPRPGDPVTTTARGLVIIERFRAEYKRLRCDEVMAASTTPGPKPYLPPRSPAAVTPGPSPAPHPSPSR